MSKINLDYINRTLIEKGDRPFKLEELEYPDVITDGNHLLDKELLKNIGGKYGRYR